MSYVADFALNLGAANSGLTLKAAIVGIDLVLVTKDISIAGEIGAGSYYARVTMNDGQRGFVAFYTGTVGSGTDLSGVTIKALAALDAELEYADAPVSSRSTFAAGEEVDLVDSLNANALDQIAAAVEAHILDENDGDAVLQAVVDKINAADPDLSGLTLSAIAQAARDVSNASPAAGSVGAVINAIVAKTTNLPAQPAAVGSNMGLSAGAIAAIEAMFSTTTNPELGSGVCPATPTLRQLLMLLYMALRNDSEATSAERRVKNNAGDVILKAPCADNGTFSQGQLGAP